MPVNPQRDFGQPMFRHGKWITAGALIGAVLIAAGCFGGVFTAFEMDEGNWQQNTWLRFGFVFSFFFAGFFSIAASILRPPKMLFVSGLIAAAIAAGIAYFPSGAQLAAGPDFYIGEIESIVVPKQFMKARIKPMSGTVSTGLAQPQAQVTMRLNSGEQKVLNIGCRDLAKHLGVEIDELSQPISGTWKLVHLRHLDRVLALQQE